MKKKIIFLLSLAAVLLAFAVRADVFTPTITKVYFEKDGQPYENPVKFIVKCYGYTYAPGSDPGLKQNEYEPEIVFSYSAICPGYGCEISESYYLNYYHTDYCDLEGETEGKKFVLEKYAQTPLPENCFYPEEKKEDERGNIFIRECEQRFAIPADLAEGTIEPAPEPQPQPELQSQPAPQSTPELKPAKQSFFKRIFCFFKRLFGGFCD